MNEQSAAARPAHAAGGVGKVLPKGALGKQKLVPAELKPIASEFAALLGWQRVGVLEPERVLYAKDAGTTSQLPALVVFPDTTEEVASIVRICSEHKRPYTARGAGTGLAGGAVPSEGGVIISLQRMNAILEIDADNRRAWVQPGVVNLDITKAVKSYGLHFAPDPSSQQACTVGGNVANNSGGPHCLLYGVTSAHILEVEAVLSSGEVVMLGGDEGYDLRGIFVGSEGMCGIATRICVRLMPDQPAVATLLATFTSTEDASSAVSGIIAGGIVPAALEMMDQAIVKAVANFLRTDDYPVDAAAVLLVEVDGMPAGVEEKAARVDEILRACGAVRVTRAADEAQRARLWKGRKSAFGAVGQYAPHYYLHDCVIPRTKLTEVLAECYAIAARHELMIVNVFHAGDGNLHPLLVFDATKPGVPERVEHASHEIIELCVRVGGTLTGEHGVGLEKREHMPKVFTPDDLDAQAKIPRAFDPDVVANPDKVFPRGSRCGDFAGFPSAAAGEKAGLWV